MEQRRRDADPKQTQGVLYVLCRAANPVLDAVAEHMEYRSLDILYGVPPRTSTVAIPRMRADGHVPIPVLRSTASSQSTGCC